LQVFLWQCVLLPLWGWHCAAAEPLPCVACSCGKFSLWQCVRGHPCCWGALLPLPSGWLYLWPGAGPGWVL